MTLIAKILIVASTVGAGGVKVRKEFKPGEEVTGLSDHDERELLKMKALADTDREEASDQYDAMRAEHAQREFERERQAVQQQRESTHPAGAATPVVGTVVGLSPEDKEKLLKELREGTTGGALIPELMEPLEPVKAAPSVPAPSAPPAAPPDPAPEPKEPPKESQKAPRGSKRN
ncbi:hypothetical protein [Comamonas sp. A7-5]|uniref:hypothetical protein n=1 Tax=Comamonas sp. A7-5 TaxID=673549 RepID=UPI0031CEA421